MALTQTETLGLTNKLTAALTEHAPKFLAKGFDPSITLTDLEKLRVQAVNLDTEQEKMKVLLKEQTKKVAAAYLALYRATSAAINTTAGVLDHTTEAGKSLLELRSQVRNAPNDEPGERNATAKTPA